MRRQPVEGYFRRGVGQDHLCSDLGAVLQDDAVSAALAVRGNALYLHHGTYISW